MSIIELKRKIKSERDEEKKAALRDVLFQKESEQLVPVKGEGKRLAKMIGEK